MSPDGVWADVRRVLPAFGLAATTPDGYVLTPAQQEAVRAGVQGVVTYWQQSL